MDADTVTSECTLSPTRQRRRAAPWQPGQSGNPKGRPKGSRNVLSQTVFNDLLNYYADNGNGARLIAQVAEENPVAFLQLVVRLLPRQTEIESVVGNSAVTLSPAQMRRIAELWLSQNPATD